MRQELQATTAQAEPTTERSEYEHRVTRLPGRPKTRALLGGFFWLLTIYDVRRVTNVQDQQRIYPLTDVPKIGNI